MNINRAVVKQQAKDIIKGNIFKLFLISLVVGILAGTGTFSFNVSDFDDIKDYFTGDKNPFSDEFDKDDDKDDPFVFDEGSTEYDRNFFNEFDGNGKVALNTAFAGLGGIFAGALAGVGFLMVAKRLLLGPLQIMLDGLYWQLIRGNNMELSDGFGYVFKKTFDKNYMQKFLLNLIKDILLALLYCLFIVPGVIFTYKWYFTGYIMAENPELTFEQAMNISKKMTNNHKGELFVLDLSFLGWYLLMVPTLGLASIYVTPYVSTTKALYYENFKIRAFQEGAVTQYDYMSATEKLAAQAQTGNQYYAPAQQQTYYTPVSQPATQQENTYYAPAAPTPQPTAEQYYQPAPQPVAEPVQPEAAPEITEAAAEAPSENYYTPTESPQSTEE